MGKSLVAWGLFLAAVLPALAVAPAPEALQQPARHNTSSASLAELSQYLKAVSKTLYEKYGVERILVGGGSSRSVLDHLYGESPIDMRDLDVFIVTGKTMNHEQIEAMAHELEKAGVGTLQAHTVNPKTRPDPGLLTADGLRNTGWGFFVDRNEHSYLDLSIFNTEHDLSLNGIFNIDTVMIPIDHDTDLMHVVHDQISKKPFRQLVQEGRVLDAHGGYVAWAERKPEVFAWGYLKKDPAAFSARLVRGYFKAGGKSVPAADIERMRQALAKGPATEVSQLMRNLTKILEDPAHVQEFKAMIDIGSIRAWSPALSDQLSALSVDELSALFGKKPPAGMPLGEFRLGQIIAMQAPKDQADSLRWMAQVAPKTNSLLHQVVESATILSCPKALSSVRASQ